MATVIYKPKDPSIGEALGNLLGVYTARKVNDSRQQGRTKAISDYISQLDIQQTGRVPGAAPGDAVQPGQDIALQQAQEALNPDDFLKLLIMARKQRGNLTKVPAYEQKTGKETTYATYPSDLQSGKAEKDANTRGLTLIDPQKNKPGKPTDTDKAISDLLSDKGLQSNAGNRRKAREFLTKRKKAEDIINRSFGKRLGQEWIIEAGTNKEMADLATSQVEGLIFDDGLSADQAGTTAVRIAREVFKQRIEQENAPVQSTNEDSGLLDKISNIFSGNTSEQSSQDTQTGAEDMEPLGNINGVDVSYPSSMDDPRAIADYIAKTYKIPFDDVRSWLISNAPQQ